MCGMNLEKHVEEKLNIRKLIAAILTLAVSIPVGMVGAGFVGYHLEHRCTESDKALSQATNFRGPVDYQDAQAHPEKLRYARAQVRAIQRCGW